MRPVPLLLLVLTACTAAPPLPEVRIVKMPVPVPCVKASELPTQPKIASNAELNALGDFDLVISLASERLDLLKLSGEQTALLKACVQ